MNVAILPPARAALVTATLCEAFFEYPVMRFVLGTPTDYAEQLRKLIGFFVASRVLRQDLLLGVAGPSGDLAGVALVNLPGDRPVPGEMAERREALWRELGSDARGRYEAFGKAAGQFELTAPHHHLNMIGVGPAYQGQGYGRLLLDYVRDLAEADPGSAGVTLSTETPGNLALYQRFGYRILGHAAVGTGLETWVLHRSRGVAPPA